MKITVISFVIENDKSCGNEKMRTVCRENSCTGCMYKGLEEYGYITGRSLAIKGISLLALFLFVKTRQDYVAYALISSLATGTFSTAVMSVCVLGLMLLKLPNTIGLIVEVGCGALVYIAINLMMKNALMFEMIQRFKTKLLHKA